MEENKKYGYEDEIEIDLKELFFALLNKWYLIFLAGLLCGLIGLVGTMFLIPEKYESKTSVYSINNDQQNNDIAYADLQIGTVLTKDYEVLVKGRTVLESVIEMLGLNLSYGALNSMVSVSTPDSTRIIEISVRTTDPYLSRDIANAVREVSSKSIAEVMGVDAVNVVETANLPETKCSPSTSKNTVLGGMIGVVIACGILVLLYVLNDTIRTQDDVEKYLGISTLGIIPIDDALAADEKKRKRAQKSSRKKSVPKKMKV